MMKRTILLLLCLILAMGVAGCGEKVVYEEVDGHEYGVYKTFSSASADDKLKDSPVYIDGTIKSASKNSTTLTYAFTDESDNEWRLSVQIPKDSYFDQEVVDSLKGSEGRIFGTYAGLSNDKPSINISKVMIGDTVVESEDFYISLTEEELLYNAVTAAISSKYKNGEHFEVIVREQDGSYVIGITLDPDDAETFNLAHQCGLEIESIKKELISAKASNIADVLQYNVNFISNGELRFSTYLNTLEETVYPLVGPNGTELHMKSHEEYLALEAEHLAWLEQQKVADYKAQCNTYSYEEISRNPDNYKGLHAKFTGEVVQVLESGSKVNLRINVTKGRYFYTDTIYVIYTSEAGAGRILEDDIVTFYGTLQGLYSYESVMGATITIPRVDAEYIDIH